MLIRFVILGHVIRPIIKGITFRVAIRLPTRKIVGTNDRVDFTVYSFCFEHSDLRNMKYGSPVIPVNATAILRIRYILPIFSSQSVVCSL
jgi:hypothetical protein